MTEKKIDEQIALLNIRDVRAGCRAMKALQQASRENIRVYAYMDRFAQLMENGNSYVRTRALILIAANAQWDVDHKIDKILGSYLRHITDAKPITARQCIQSLPVIAEYKPELKKEIGEALRNADISSYADSMRPLIGRDIQAALSVIETQK